jgi:exosortase/archaeosortase family protein
MHSQESAPFDRQCSQSCHRAVARRTFRSRAATVLRPGGPRARLARVVASEKVAPRGAWRAFVSREGRGPEARFVFSFVLIAGALFSLYSFPYREGSWPQRWSEGYLQAYAHLAGWVLSLFERGVVVSGQDITGRYALRIIRGCDAVDAQILLVAAVLASQVYSWRWRVGGALAGLAAITVANVVRICCLYYVGFVAPSYFDFFHHEFWPLLLIVFAAATFVLWSKIAAARGGAMRAVG